MSELKPCPFCGEPVYLDKVPLWSSYNGITHGYGGCYEFDVHCRNPKCGCSIKLTKNNTIYSDEKEARLNAIEAWNRRSTERKRGEWVWDTDAIDWDIGAWCCSECQSRNDNIPHYPKTNPLIWHGTKYCPNCGADMRGKGNE